MTDAIVQLIANYVAGPSQLRESVRGMSPEELAARPIAGKWATQQAICHLTDFEIINAERIQRTIAEDNPTIFVADPDSFAANLHHEHRAVAAEIDLIAALRSHIAAILRRLNEQQWHRTANHSTDGPLTLTQLVERTTRHIPHHLPFIAEKREALR